jgi:type IV pilus assembly protein PilM
LFSAKAAATGIDIGASSVKLVRARAGVRPERILNAAIEPIPPGSESWPAAAAGSLSLLLRRLKLHRGDLGRVSLAVSGAAVSLKQVDLPVLSDTELRKSLKYEARKHLTLENPALSAVDCQVLSSSGETMSVLFAGAPEELVESRVRILDQAGIEPEVVDVASLAILNGLYAQTDLDPGATLAVIDMGSSAVTITMDRRNGPIYTRTLPALNGDEMWEVAGRLSTAFEETAQFFSSMNERRPVDRVFLAGGGALTPGLEDHLASQMGLPVSTMDLTRGLNYSPTGSGDLSRQELNRLAPQMTVAVGLLYWGGMDV